MQVIGASMAAGNFDGLRGALITLKDLTKALAANRWSRGRQIMQQLGPTLFPSLSSFFAQTFAQTLSRLDSSNLTQSIPELDICCFALPILRILTVYGFSKADKGTPASVRALATFFPPQARYCN